MNKRTPRTNLYEFLGCCVPAIILGMTVHSLGDAILLMLLAVWANRVGYFGGKGE